MVNLIQVNAAWTTKSISVFNREANKFFWPFIIYFNSWMIGLDYSRWTDPCSLFFVI